MPRRDWSHGSIPPICQSKMRSPGDVSGINYGYRTAQVYGFANGVFQDKWERNVNLGRVRTIGRRRRSRERLHVQCTGRSRLRLQGDFFETNCNGQSIRGTGVRREHALYSICRKARLMKHASAGQNTIAARPRASLPAPALPSDCILQPARIPTTASRTSKHARRSRARFDAAPMPGRMPGGTRTPHGATV